jgi:Tfp pilus assembly protein PilF
LNFGLVGHTPATATTVDYLIRKNPDRSVSCIVGAMDLPSRTQWRVTFTLPPDKAYFETKALWYNPQPLNQSYYMWMNAANKFSGNLEFILPGTSRIGHNYDEPEKPWPMTADGRNLALYKDHADTEEGSFFVFGELEDFSGGYWHDSDFGYGHWALYEDMPGQKFFRWRLSRAGAIWENLLTDNDGHYFEPQMGRLLDQNDHAFFAPYTADQWREVWFPYKEIGPMVKATPYGALNVRNLGSQVVLGFNALQNVDEDLVVLAAGKEVYRERLKLEPMGVYEKKLPLAVEKGELQVTLGKLLSYSDDPNANLLKRPLNFRNYEENTPEGLYQAAEQAERQRNYKVALAKYLDCLKQDPNHMRALTRIASLYCRRAEYAKALEYAHKALDFAMYDADANYIYGVISRRMGNLVDAKETLGWAARSMEYRAGAYCQMAEIYLMEGNFDLAREYLRRSLNYDALNVKTYQVLSTFYRLTGQPAKARETLGKVLEIDPLNHLARFETYLLEPGDENLKSFRSMIRNELPHETYLETAMYYVNLGLADDALRLLEVAPDQPTIRYWQAYLLREKSPGQSRELLRKAAALSPNLVRPFREESIPVFQWADEALPESWKADYYLGLIYWGRGRNDDARTAMAAAGDRPDYAPFYIWRASLDRESRPQEALADYERAYKTDQTNWRTSYQLASFYLVQDMPEKALQLAVAAGKQFPEEDLIKILLARTYLNNGKYKDCDSILGEATILPFEGQRDVHGLFVQCQICSALEGMKQGRYAEAISSLEDAKEYPERLGTGKPHNPDFRVQDYLIMLCYEHMNMPAKAAEARQRIAAYSTKSSDESFDTMKRKVDDWYRTALPKQSELTALQELSVLIRGGNSSGH